MLALIPLGALLGLIALLATLRPLWDWRQVALRAAVLWAVWAAATVEVLSLWRAITPLGLTIAWSALVVLEGMSLAWLIRRGARPRWPRARQPQGWVERAIAAAVIAILVLTAVVAWFAPPSTWDSLNYHMPRLAHWAQERTLRPFATGIEVQNSRSPGAEMVVLHLYVLGWGDRLVNFVAWFAFAASVLAAGWIAQGLGGGPRTQLAASLFSATAPMAIVQASSTMTDGVVGLWSICAAAECLAFERREAGAVWWAALAGGLALLTKPTAVAYLLPFAIWIAILALRRTGWRRALTQIGVAAVLVGVLNAGTLVRNWSLYGSPLDPDQVAVHSTARRDPRGILSNLLRTLSMQIGTPSPHVNRGIYLAVVGIHEWLGLDPNDPRTTSAGEFAVRAPLTDEDLTTNPLHSILYFAAFVVILIRRRGVGKGAVLYAVSVASTLVVFSALIKWQIFGSRYLLPFFVLFSPAAAVALERAVRPAWAGILSLLLILTSLPWLTGVRSRPLIERMGDSYVRSVVVESRATLYFANGRYLQDPYTEMADEIEAMACSDVGLMLGGNAAEYPLWVLLGAPREGLRIEWIVADTPSARFEDPSFEPCAVICDETCPADWERVRGLPLRYEQSGFRLFLKPAE